MGAEGLYAIEYRCGPGRRILDPPRIDIRGSADPIDDDVGQGELRTLSPSAVRVCSAEREAPYRARGTSGGSETRRIQHAGTVRISSAPFLPNSECKRTGPNRSVGRVSCMWGAGSARSPRTRALARARPWACCEHRYSNTEVPFDPHSRSRNAARNDSRFVPVGMTYRRRGGVATAELQRGHRFVRHAEFARRRQLRRACTCFLAMTIAPHCSGQEPLARSDLGRTTMSSTAQRMIAAARRIRIRHSRGSRTAGANEAVAAPPRRHPVRH